MPPVDDQLRLLGAGAAELISAEELRAKLERGRPLRVKLGIDPTASDIHLGFAVVLRRLRLFQDLGHVAVLIVGDFTAMVGDPTGRSATRPRLSREEVETHAATYVAQVTRILDPSPERLEVRRNSEWLAPLGIDDVLRLAASTTVARMLERDDFARRLAAGAPVSLMELLYPLLQGRDSLAVAADVELGGTDQLFNILVGRHLQQQAGAEPQVVLTVPLIEGLDGARKMSKSYGNTVGIAEPAPEQYGKVMSIPDALMPGWFAHTTGWPPGRAEEVLGALDRGDLAPVDAKRLLARTIVDLYHGGGAGQRAEAEFDRVFRAHRPPSDVPEYRLPAGEVTGGTVKLARVLVLSGLAPSNREARRQIAQGGVHLDGEAVPDPEVEVPVASLDGAVLQRGKRHFRRLRV